jgi:hypothetical protein
MSLFENMHHIRQINKELSRTCLIVKYSNLRHSDHHHVKIHHQVYVVLLLDHLRNE